MRALTELLIVFVAAFFGFFALIAALFANLVWFAVVAVAGFFSAASLLIALFAGLGFALTGSHHDAGLAVAYSLYAAASFAVVVVLLFYRDKLRQAVQVQRAPPSIQGFRLALNDAPFEPGVIHH
ncbi:MAG: hypothetical protein ACRYGM_16105 [Janthinobacterium lividum]